MGSSSLPGECTIVSTFYALLRRFATLSLLTGAALSPLTLSAQGASGSSPLGEQTVFPRIGIEGGFDLTGQEGSYSVGCGTFDEGSGTNLTIGLSYDKPLSEQFRVEGLLGFRLRNVSHAYPSQEPSVIQTADGFVETTIDYDNVGRITASSLFLQPSIRYAPVEFFYIGVGVNAGVILSTTTHYRKDITSRVVELTNGETIEAFYPAADSDDPYSRSFAPEDPEAAGLLLDPVAYAGLDFSVGDHLFIGPRFTFALPLMPLFSEPEVTLSSMQFTLGARYNLE
jgi:hypothetical protein